MRGDSMTKTLQEIQEFNRRKIICAVNLTRLEEYEDENLTLNKVLLSLGLRDFSIAKPELKFYNGFIITINGYAWDLTKPTLEEQSEETQRAFYELLGGENE
jgi:hypothetical protein